MSLIYKKYQYKILFAILESGDIHFWEKLDVLSSLVPIMLSYCFLLYNASLFFYLSNCLAKFAMHMLNLYWFELFFSEVSLRQNHKTKQLFFCYYCKEGLVLNFLTWRDDEASFTFQFPVLMLSIKTWMFETEKIGMYIYVNKNS